MKSYQPKLLRPKVLNSKKIESWFTLKGNSVQNEVNISGFNLGFNTDESVSVIQINREQLAEIISVPISDIAFANQVHSADVEIVSEGGIYEGIDGFITQTKGLALAIQVADCAAVLFGDAETGTIAAVHAGWRGAAGGIVEKAIQKMVSLNCDPKNIEVFVSPCIATINFEVGEEVAAHFPDRFVDRNNYAKPHIDLKGFIKQQLIDLGILEHHIEINARCTVSDSDFYSYRREGKASGRMMGIIKLNK